MLATRSSDVPNLQALLQDAGGGGAGQSRRQAEYDSQAIRTSQPAQDDSSNRFVPGQNKKGEGEEKKEEKPEAPKEQVEGDARQASQAMDSAEPMEMQAIDPAQEGAPETALPGRGGAARLPSSTRRLPAEPAAGDEFRGVRSIRRPGSMRLTEADAGEEAGATEFGAGLERSMFSNIDLTMRSQLPNVARNFGAEGGLGDIQGAIENHLSTIAERSGTNLGRLRASAEEAGERVSQLVGRVGTRVQSSLELASRGATRGARDFIGRVGQNFSRASVPSAELNFIPIGGASELVLEGGGTGAASGVATVTQPITRVMPRLNFNPQVAQTALGNGGGLLKSAGLAGEATEGAEMAEIGEVAALA